MKIVILSCTETEADYPSELLLRTLSESFSIPNISLLRLRSAKQFHRPWIVFTCLREVYWAPPMFHHITLGSIIVISFIVQQLFSGNILIVLLRILFHFSPMYPLSDIFSRFKRFSYPSILLTVVR